MIILKEDFEEGINPYFREFLRICSITVGTEVKSYYFMQWVTKKHTKFCETEGSEWFGIPYATRIPEYQKAFETWLMSLPEGSESYER